jgi:hypothetical protein
VMRWHVISIDEGRYRAEQRHRQTGKATVLLTR